jgi:group II intron reverse transcriptase/maturase
LRDRWSEPDGASEVGLPDSSVEAYESTWSEAGNKSTKTLSEARTAREVVLGVEHGLKDLRYLSREYAQVQALMSRVNAEALKREHTRQERRKAKGVDGVTKDEYGQNLDANIADLLKRMKSFSYRPLPVRRTYIPKANGKKRPLGIPSYEDKLVQGVMAGILTDVYEERFCDSSYGYRPGRSAHDVVRYVNTTIMSKKVGYALEADIKSFFDSVDHEWLMTFLGRDIADPNFLRYIKRFLIGGVMEGTERKESDKGTPQGGLISPVLANVYLHYALDLWVEKVLKEESKGEVHYVRYADDFLLLFQYENDATAALKLLKERLKKFSLEVADEKTRILPMGRFKGTKDDFDFLGFTFHNGKTREGKYRLGVRTSEKKLKSQRQDVKAWMKTRLTKPVAETMKLVSLALRGHVNYYGVNGNMRKIVCFWNYVKHRCYRMLNRRDQRGRIRWDKFQRMWDFHIESPRLPVDIWSKKPTLA